VSVETDQGLEVSITIRTRESIHTAIIASEIPEHVGSRSVAVSRMHHFKGRDRAVLSP